MTNEELQAKIERKQMRLIVILIVLAVGMVFYHAVQVGQKVACDADPVCKGEEALKEERRQHPDEVRKELKCNELLHKKLGEMTPLDLDYLKTCQR